MDVARRTEEKGPSDLETAKIEAGVEVVGALLDRSEDASVPSR